MELIEMKKMAIIIGILRLFIILFIVGCTKTLKRICIVYEMSGTIASAFEVGWALVDWNWVTYSR